MASVRTESSDDEERPPVISVPAGASLPSDPSVNVAKLPDDHPVHLLTEARLKYSDSIQPPFTVRIRAATHIKGPRKVIIPTASGGRPRNPKLTELVARTWNDKLRF